MSDDISEISQSQGKKERNDVEDHRLKNYYTWLRTWEDIQNRLSTNTNQIPEALVMNYGDDLKYVNTEKTLLEYAKIPTEFDKYRGKPDFWKLPLALPRKYKYCKHEPDYFAVQTKPEKYIIPSLEIIGTPDYVLFEKHILHNTRTIYSRWRNSEYREEQIKKFQSKMEAILPHYPRFSQLIVLGNSLRSKKEKPLEESLSTSEPASSSIKEEEEGLAEVAVPLKRPKLSLKINGDVFNRLTTTDEFSRNFRVSFEYDVTSRTEMVEYVNLENSGLTTLRISWQKLDKFKLFRNYSSEKLERGFNFNKNDLIILPGEMVEFPIWFKSDSSGVFSECWKLSITPKLWDDDFKVMLILHSYAYYGDFKEKVDAILKYIDIQVRNDIIRDTLLSIFEEIRYTETPVKPCYYGEVQLFEMTNLNNDIPSFLYDKIIVEELKEIYNRLLNKPRKWTYSIKELKKLAHDRDTEIYLENKNIEIAEKIEKMRSLTREQSALQAKTSSHAKKPKTPKTKKEKAKKQKTKKQSSKMSQKSDIESEPEPVEEKKENYIYTNQMELENVLKKLHSPVIINTKREKYFACCKVLCAYFTKMCHSLDTLENEYNYKKTVWYPPFVHKLTPINLQPKRLIYEYFEEHYLPKFSVGQRFSTEVKPKPKPKILEDVPQDDVEAVYAAYTGMSTAGKKPESKTKTKKEKEKKSKHEKKIKPEKKPDPEKKPKKSKSKSEEIMKTEEIKQSTEWFDPYEEVFIYKPECDPEVYHRESIQNWELPKNVEEEYKYRQYLTVYSCLSEAVDAVVDTIESFECVVSHATLKEVKESYSRLEKKKKIFFN